MLDVNVVGMARVSRAALPHLRRSAAAAIVNTSSIAAIGGRQRALYTASKGAVAALTLAMAADHLREGIRVNAVPRHRGHPLGRPAPRRGRRSRAAAEALRARQPLGRLISADEVAYGIASLASPLAASTTGTILRIDGGMTSLRL